MGRFAYQIINAFGELERALIAERTKAGMVAAQQRGVQIGRPRKLSACQVDSAKHELAGDRVTLAELADTLEQISFRSNRFGIPL